MEQKRQQGLALRQRLDQLGVENDNLALKKTALALQHKDQVAKLRVCHEGLLEAEIRIVEAASDVEALKERNSGIVKQLEDERRLVQEAERESKAFRVTAARALEVCQAIKEEADSAGNLQHFQLISQDLTIEALEHDIAAEQSKLEFVHAGNPNVIKEFERRQVEVEKLRENIREADEKLTNLNRQITDVRVKWESELDKLIAEISKAFSHNFEQIGCAGEVSVHKDDDFDLWSIEIKVKFR
jgi:chromosome segregation ATPase